MKASSGGRADRLRGVRALALLSVRDDDQAARGLALLVLDSYSSLLLLDA